MEKSIQLKGLDDQWYRWNQYNLIARCFDVVVVGLFTTVVDHFNDVVASDSKYHHLKHVMILKVM